MSEVSHSLDEPYELALLQFRPGALSEEAVNIGVIALSLERPQLRFEFSERYGRIKSLFPDLEGVAYRRLVRQVQQIAQGLSAQLSPDGRQAPLVRPFPDLQTVLRLIVPKADGLFGWSSVRYGISADLNQTVTTALHRYVTRFEEHETRPRVDDETLWRTVISIPAVAMVISKLRPDYPLRTNRYEYKFRAGWTNGRVQVVEPISLDYLDPGDMLEEAMRWRGRLGELAETNDFLMTALVTEPPTDSASTESYFRSLEVLKEIPTMRAVVPAGHGHDFAALVLDDLGRPKPPPYNAAG